MGNKYIIQESINTLSRLPGIGERSAQRIIFYLMQKKETLFFSLLKQLDTLFQEIKTCELCNNIDIKNPCNICSSELRNQKQICIVEDISSVWALEKSRAYKGTYYILNGVLDAKQDNNITQNKICKLLNRINDKNIEEIILATSLTVEGQTTAFYIKDKIDQLKNTVKVTTLAQGVPIGGEIDYLDELTLETALKLRKLL